MKHLNPEPAPMAIRAVLPGLLVLFACAVILVPTPDFVFGRVHIMLPLIFVFHWTIFRPECVHWGVIVALGLVTDLWSEAIVGLSPLMMYGFSRVAASLRDDLYTLRFEWRWVAFAVLSAIYIAAYWLITAGLLGLRGAHIDLVGRWLLSCGIYPAAIWLFVILERRVLYPRRRA